MRSIRSSVCGAQPARESSGWRPMSMTRYSRARAICRRSSRAHWPRRLVTSGWASMKRPAYGAGGLRDTTRIAASSAEMWRDIVLTNRDAILDVAQAFSRRAGRVRAGDCRGRRRTLRGNFQPRARDARGVEMTRSRPVIAIDGPVGAGKSTVARRLAEVLGFELRQHRRDVPRGRGGGARRAESATATGGDRAQARRAARLRADRLLTPGASCSTAATSAPKSARPR